VADGAETPDNAFFTDKEDSTGAGMFSDPAAHPPEMVHNDLKKQKGPYEQNMQPLQIGQMKLQHHGASMEGWSSTIDSCFQERRMAPQSIEPR
jgi:hypothetical protein